MSQFLGKATPLSGAGFSSVCDGLGGDSCSLWSLVTVETKGFGFLPDGRPKMLFERHVFHRLTNGRYDAGYPGISNSKPGGYQGGAGEYDRLAQASQLDPGAALDSASWGLGQIMGFNAKGLGYASAADMVAQFADGEDRQLDAVRRFIVGNHKLNNAFLGRDWQKVALYYNGADYAKNEYDAKLDHYFNYYTKNGVPNLDLRTAQAWLTILGFDPKGVDGVFGGNTSRALNDFRKSKGMPVSSALDSATSEALAAAVKARRGG